MDKFLYARKKSIILNTRGDQGANDFPLPPEHGGQLLCDRVIALRKKRGLTLDQLASACGVSRSMLSQIERGRANPTLAVTLRIAQAFGLSIGDLVDQPWTASTIEVVRGDDATHLFRDDRECRIRTLSPLHLEKSVEFYELRIAPRAQLYSAPTSRAPGNY